MGNLTSTEIIFTIVCPALGMITGNVMFSAPYRAVRRATIEGHLGDLNPTPWAFMLGNCIGWLAYSFLTVNYYLFAGNAPGFLLSVWMNMQALKLQYGVFRIDQARKTLVTALERHHSKHIGFFRRSFSRRGGGGGGDESTKRVIDTDESSYTDASVYTNDPYTRYLRPRRSRRRQRRRRLSVDFHRDRDDDDHHHHHHDEDDHPTRAEKAIDYAHVVGDVLAQRVKAPVAHENLVFANVLVWLVVLSVIIFAGTVFSNETSALIVGVVGNANLVFFYGAPLSTIFTVIKTRNSASIHRWTMIANTFNGYVWAAYGIATFDLPVGVPNAIGALLGTTQVVLCLLFPRKPLEGDEEEKEDEKDEEKQEESVDDDKKKKKKKLKTLDEFYDDDDDDDDGSYDYVKRKKSSKVRPSVVTVEKGARRVGVDGGGGGGGPRRSSVRHPGQRHRESSGGRHRRENTDADEYYEDDDVVGDDDYYYEHQQQQHKVGSRAVPPGRRSRRITGVESPRRSRREEFDDDEGVEMHPVARRQRSVERSRSTSRPRRESFDEEDPPARRARSVEGRPLPPRKSLVVDGGDVHEDDYYYEDGVGGGRRSSSRPVRRSASPRRENSTERRRSRSPPQPHRLRESTRVRRPAPEPYLNDEELVVGEYSDEYSYEAQINRRDPAGKYGYNNGASLQQRQKPYSSSWTKQPMVQKIRNGLDDEIERGTMTTDDQETYDEEYDDIAPGDLSTVQDESIARFFTL